MDTPERLDEILAGNKTAFWHRQIQMAENPGNRTGSREGCWS
jgi:hypothetical protein